VKVAVLPAVDRTRLPLAQPAVQATLRLLERFLPPLFVRQVVAFEVETA